MKIALVTDAWQPQTNGVVTALVALVRELTLLGHEVEVIHPGRFDTWPCPGHPDIALAFRARRKLEGLLLATRPDAIHLATEGPLGWAARRWCLRNKQPFTTACHTRFPELLKATVGLPLGVGYALFRRFHRPSHGVMVPSKGVMTLLEAKGFRRLRPWTQGVDIRLFGFEPVPQTSRLLGALPRPVSLYVGRLSVEKGVEDYLAMDLPGSKVVCGTGPLEAKFKQRYPDVHWLGVLPRHELAQVYASADVLVFPCRTETFGLVLLEAMASGTPVAAYPVVGPAEILGKGLGGVLSEDLQQATLRALALPRHHARLRALDFGWTRAAQLFVEHLVPMAPPSVPRAEFRVRGGMQRVALSVRPLSPLRHKSGE